jgi:cytoskeletal protein CcmA (bactofilin family)
MFFKTKDDTMKNSNSQIYNSSNNKVAPSIISSDLVISGEITGDGEVQIDGKIEGDVNCKSLLIGINGHVIGSVNADEAKVHGCITGQLRAAKVFLASTARMCGDVTHESIAIEPGAFVDGHCRRIDDPIPAEQAEPDLMITDARKEK